MGEYIYTDNLKSKHLTTRFLTRKDIPIWIEFLQDKSSTKYLPPFGDATPEKVATNWISKQLERYSNKNLGLQALILKETGAFIGMCGLLTQEINGETEVEVGYHILKEYRGHGYASEAAKLFIKYAFENNITDAVISIIDVQNVASQRIAEKNGLVREENIQWNGLDIFIYRIVHS